MGTVAGGEYAENMPEVQDYLECYRRALDRVRVTHCGKPTNEVLVALMEAFDAEGIEVWDEVARDAASLISAEREGLVE